MDIQKKNDALERLERQYAGRGTQLEYSDEFQLLVAVMLSAQCTDTRVNKVTPELFKNYGTAEKMAKLTADELEVIIRSCGLAPSKSKNIVAASKRIIDEYGGRVPSDIDALRSLPGVGRKTANVVASVAFGIPALAVDTHVFRTANRVGLADGKDALTVENQLTALIPREKWSLAHHWLIWHGRDVCHARKPECTSCFLKDICDFAAQSGAQEE